MSKRIANLTKTEILQKAANASSRDEYRELSVQQLRTAVREAVKDVNIRAQYRDSEQSKVALAKLKIAGLEVKDIGNYEKAKSQIARSRVAGNVNYKSKEQLIDQLQALKKYQRADTESEQARQEYEEGFKEAFKNFGESDAGEKYKDMDYEDFKNILNKLDTFESAISKKEFKYEIFEAVKTARDQGKDVNLDDVFDAIKNGNDVDDAINNMYQTMGVVRK